MSSICIIERLEHQIRAALLLILCIAAGFVLLINPASARAAAQADKGISGTVTFNGSKLPGVVITVTGSTSTSGETNDRDGVYLVIVPSGHYVVTPSKDGYTFEPAQRNVDVDASIVNGVDFIAASSAPADPTPTPTPSCGVDSDSDGASDCADSCPSDPLKTEPGICDCGTADIDANSDGAVDCLYDGDTPLSCGEEPTVVIGERLVTDNKALGELTLSNIKRLKKLIGAVGRRYGGKEGTRLRQLAQSYKKAVVKIDARTQNLVESLPSILVPCPGQIGQAEVSNAAAKTEMRSNTDALKKIGLKVLTRLLFYQIVRNPFGEPSAKKKAKFKADKKAAAAQIGEIYERVNALIDKVPDVTVVTE